jgi:hypothetical protein
MVLVEHDKHSKQLTMLKEHFLQRVASEREMAQTSSTNGFYVEHFAAELHNGCLTDCPYWCKSCCKALTGTTRTAPTIPCFALCNGLYPGPVPDELCGLTSVEKTMISVYSIITKASIRCGQFARKRGTTYAIVNDLATVAATLPRAPSYDTYVILRRTVQRGACTKDYHFRPARVKAALVWLKDNNHLYKDIILEFYEEPSLDWESAAEHDIPHVELQEADELGVDLELPPEEGAGFVQSKNSGESVDGASDRHVLALNSVSTELSLLDELKQTLSASAKQSSHLATDQQVVIAPNQPLEFAHPYKQPEFFLSRSFPTLFPYGRGCPTDPCTQLSNWGQHSKLMLSRGLPAGLRRFQQEPNYYFAVLAYEMRRKVGGVAYQAQHEEYDHDVHENDVTVSTMLSLIEYVEEMKGTVETESTVEASTLAAATVGVSSTTPNVSTIAAASPLDPTPHTVPTVSPEQLKRFIARMVPYGNSLKGTALHMAYEARKLRAMIASPIIKQQGSFRWFVTFAPADRYDIRLFENCVKPPPPRVETDETAAEFQEARWEPRSADAQKLTLAQRDAFLVSHPALCARLFALKQACLWEHVINGRAQPLGACTDQWRRTEFQDRGAPHVHALVAVAEDGISLQALDLPHGAPLPDNFKEMVDKVVTAQLAERCAPSSSNNMITDDYNFNIPWEGHIEDSEDPRKLPFDPELNYHRENTTGFSCPQTQDLYHCLQCLNQLHRCTRSCHKYRQVKDPDCRFGFPFERDAKTSTTSTVLYRERDHKGRVRAHVYPMRNNAHVNNTAFSPLLVIAHGGNHDIKCIDTAAGSAEYAAAYASKSDAADFTVLQNLIARKLGQIKHDRERLRTVATALIESSTIAAVHACYTVLGLSFVESSRTVLMINALPFNQLRHQLVTDLATLQKMADQESVFTHGLQTQTGRRVAYHTLVKQQRQLDAVGEIGSTTSPPLVTFFQMLTHFSLNRVSDTRVNVPPPRLIFDVSGLPDLSSGRFVINKIGYTLKKKPVILCLAPFVPVDTSEERSCFSLLLLHLPWPDTGEAGLLAQHGNAVVAYHAAMQHGLFPPYVVNAIAESAKSQTLADSSAQLTSAGTTSNNDMDDNSEHNDVVDSDEDFLNAPTEADDCSIGLPDGMNILETSAASTTHNVASNLNTAVLTKYRGFLPNALRAYMTEYARDNQLPLIALTSTEHIEDSASFHHRLPADHHHQISQLTSQQLRAYDCVLSYLDTPIHAPNHRPLMMFLSGAGGTGKSTVISCVTTYARAKFGKQKGLYGAVILAAPTGTAANNIHGFTWQSILGMPPPKRARHARREGEPYISNSRAVKIGKRIHGVKLFILDEMSMVSCEQLYAISRILQLALATTAKEEDAELIRNTPFGGIHVLLAGDLYQLPCIKATPIYKSVKGNLSVEAREGLQLWRRLNEYVELVEQMRSDDPTFKTFLSIARTATKQEVVSQDQLDYLNANVTTGIAEAAVRAKNELRANAVWLADTNEKVDAYNSTKLKEAIDDGRFAYRVIARHAAEHANITTGNTGPANASLLSQISTSLFSQADDSCPVFVDLAVGARVRCTSNLATQIGIFNGAMGTVVGFGFPQTPAADRFPKRSHFPELTRDIPVVFVRMDNYTGMPLTTEDATVVPFVEQRSQTKFKADNQDYYRYQLPLAPASAMTVHKAQSMTAKDGLVYEPSQGTPFSFSLPYVALSRACRAKDVLLLRPLTAKHFQAAPAIAEEYDRLRQQFRKFHPQCTISIYGAGINF